MYGNSQTISFNSFSSAASLRVACDVAIWIFESLILLTFQGNSFKRGFLPQLQRLERKRKSYRFILRSVKNLRPASFSRSQLRLSRLASFHKTGAQRGFDEWIFTTNHLCQEVSHGFTVLSPRSWNKINLSKPTTQINNRAQNRPVRGWNDQLYYDVFYTYIG